MININIIYILIIIGYVFFQSRNKKIKEHFEKVSKSKIENCVNKTYLVDFKSMNNLNVIAKKLNSKNNLEIPSTFDLTDSKIIINHDSNILSGDKKVNFFKKMIKHGDVISLQGKEGVFASFQNCVGKNCRVNDNVWHRQFKVEALKFIPEINGELKNNLVLDKKKLKAYQELLKKDPECRSQKCRKKYHHDWYKLHDYYNGPEGKYPELGNSIKKIGTLKFDKYVGLETPATLTSQHNSKEAYLYRKQFLKDCENKDLNYDKDLCRKVKDFKPLPKRKKGEYII